MYSSTAAVFSTVVLFAAAVSSQIANCARTYTVAAGDTCDAISATQNVSTFQLAHVNTVINANCTNLWGGQTLCLGVTGQDCTSVHKVASGEYCALIAENASISIETLIANNPNVATDCSNIYPDEVLCTASTVIIYS